MITRTLLVGCLFLLTACGHMPTQSTNATTQQAKANILNAPMGTTVWIDNSRVGTVTEDTQTFPAPSGTHTVTLVGPMGNTILKSQYFFSPNITRDISIS